MDSAPEEVGSRTGVVVDIVCCCIIPSLNGFLSLRYDIYYEKTAISYSPITEADVVYL